jgi:hypothetical protein
MQAERERSTQYRAELLTIVVRRGASYHMAHHISSPYPENAFRLVHVPCIPVLNGGSPFESAKLPSGDDNDYCAATPESRVAA